MEKTHLEKEIIKDTRICKLLKTKELRFHIGMTDKLASVDAVFNVEDKSYNIYMDSSPLDDGTTEGKEKNEAILNIYGLI